MFSSAIEFLTVLFAALYLMSIPFLLYLIWKAILEQTKYLESDDEIDQIGNINP